ncbi:MAG TPA: RNA methyltransferase [Frankiaceae bacterium]|nr:RNA methyltransferase [Frankiaceae bacterium]
MRDPRHVEAVIGDPDDPRLADYRALRDPATRVAYEREHGVFVVEGTLAIANLLASPYEVRSLLVTPAMRERLPATDAPVYVAEREVMAAVAGFDVHRGALAIATRPPPREAADVLRDARTVLALERLNDHENVGVLFRVARALGADAVLLDGETCDPLYRRAVRVSLGHVLHVPFARTDDLLGALASFTTVALTPSAETRLEDVPPPERVALLLGAEGPGLRRETIERAGVRARIAMRAGVDSLNVATAAAIALHRLGRV